MGKSQTNQATDITNENRRRTIAQTDETRGVLMGDLGEQRNIAQNTYNTAAGGYQSYMGGFGAYDPDTYMRTSAQNERNIASGGYNPEQLARLRDYTEQDRARGGYSENEYSQLAGGYGGLNPEQVGVVRGAYGDLIKTGGLSDAAADAMRRQAAGTTQSIYSTLGSKLARSQGIAGTGGAGGEIAQMARQATQAGATATTGANAEIGRLRQAGIISGTGGLAQFETGVGAGNREALQSIAGGRLRAGERAAETEASVARGTLQASAANQDLATGVAQQRIQAAGGLTNLYNSSPGYVTSLIKSIIDVQNSGGQLNNQQASIMAELSRNPGLFDNIMKGIGTVGGAVTGVITGIGGLPKGGGKG